MFIYSIRNRKNNKRYIGQTMQDGNARFRQHLSELRNNKHHNQYLQKDFNRFGEKSFDIRVLMDAENVDILNEMEVHYIEKYNCLHPNGYNKRPGGANYILKFEHKVKMAERVSKGPFNVWESSTGELIGTYSNTVLCAEELGISSNHISVLLRKVNHSILGFVAAYVGEEKPPTGKELEELYSGITSRGVLGKLKEFYAYDKFTGEKVGKFKSRAFCERELNLSMHSVSQALSGRNFTAGNYVFGYEGDPIPPLADEIKRVRRIKQSRSLGQKPFYAYDEKTGDKVGLFHTAVEFSEFSGVSSGQISKVLNANKWMSAKGYILIKIGDRRKLVLGEDYSKYKSKNNARAKGQKRFHVYNLNTGHYLSSWDTQTDCSNYYNISRRSIGNCLAGKRKYSDNYMFSYKKVKRLKVYGKSLLNDLKKKNNQNISSTIRDNDRAIVMYCASTGKRIGEFFVIKDISREFGLVDVSISRNLRRIEGYWKVGGYTFSYKGDKKPLYGEKLEEAIAWRQARKRGTMIDLFDSSGKYIATYPNSAEVSIDTGIKVDRINDWARKGRPYKGYIFKRNNESM